MIYDDKKVSYFRKTKQYSFNFKINSLSYNLSGQKLCVSLSDKILLYNAMTSNLISKLDIENKKSDFFTENTVLSLTKNTINYISFYDSSILRRFTDTDIIKNFSIGENDLFMTISNNVKIYNIKSQNPMFEVPVQNALGTFIDGGNFVIANKNIMRYYDIRNYKGPIKTKSLNGADSIRYNRYCKKIILENISNKSVILFDFDGNDTKIDVEGNGDLTSDGNYYFTAHEDKIKMYNISKNIRVFFMREPELTDGQIAINPVYNQFVTGSNNIRFWMPET